ncbi:hypothetical protein N0V87_006388 [Didymella glomerata]|uniref:F-box domain-containing protein n=1 Tax=Didymella glomerata TaxID=749621 RepID=A0A9W8WXN3_9PLEO|nr:hypothetical protein N0V87_006388 [Didymella glomerata]
MADARDFSNKLPPEMRRMICGLLSKHDLTNVRLVDKQWSAAAATVLWAQVSVDLVETATRKFDALLSHDVLSNIRDITITTESENLSARSVQSATWNLLGLLMALPRDSLQSFRSVKFKVGYHVLSAMFRAHSRINTLAVYVDESKAPGDFSSGLPSASRIQNSLSNLHCVIIHASGESSYKELSTWFPYATALDRVEIQGDSSGSGTHFTGWQPLHAGAPLFKLCHLHLLYLQFSESAGGIVGALHFPSLRRLVLGNCSTVAPLLSALAQGLRTSGSFSLAQIGIFCTEASESDVEALEKVFASLESLEVVAYSTMKGRLPSLNTLQGNADSLRNLFVDSSGFDQIYSMRDFEQLSAKLTSLKKLSLSVGDLNPMIDDLDVLEPFDLRNDEDYMKKLVAEQILGHMAVSGSKVQLLSFRPSLKVESGVEHEDEDDNGHVWPRYMYRRGDVVTHARGIAQVVKTVAVPATFEA